MSCWRPHRTRHAWQPCCTITNISRPSRAVGVWQRPVTGCGVGVSWLFSRLLSVCANKGDARLRSPPIAEVSRGHQATPSTRAPQEAPRAESELSRPGGRRAAGGGRCQRRVRARGPVIHQPTVPALDQRQAFQGVLGPLSSYH